MAKKTEKQNYTISEEERQRRSERAKALVKDGKIGGKIAGAGRPKTKRASEYVAEKAREKAAKIFKALEDALDDKNANTRIKAALAILDIERQETELKIKEKNSKLDNLNKEQLIELLAERIKQLEGQGINVNDFITSKARELRQPGRERVKDPDREHRLALTERSE